MSKIVTLEPNALMHTSSGLTGFGSFRRALIGGRELALRLGEFFLFLAEEARVGYLMAIRQSGKLFQSYVDANRLCALWQGFGFHITNDGSIPFPGSTTTNCAGLGRSLKISMLTHLNQADFSQTKVPLLERKSPRLWVGQAVIATFAFVARKSGFVACLATTEESFESEIDTDTYILQHLAMNTRCRGPIRLEKWQLGKLVIQAQQLATGFIGLSSITYESIVETTADLKMFVQYLSLPKRRIQPVFECFVHKTSICTKLFSVNCLLLGFGQ